MADVIATFDYTDEAGALLYQVCRTDPKGFHQRRPVPGYPDQWAFSLSPGKYTFDQRNGYWSPVVLNNPRPPVVELGECRKVPYRLPDLADPKRKAHPVLVAEGEGKADVLRALGFVATCNAGGAGKWQVGFGTYLVGRRVVVFPDRDDVGFAHAVQVAASCIAFGAESVRVVRYGMGWEQMPEKSDVKDWLAEIDKQGGDRKASLIDLIKLQPEWKPVGGVG
jgi:putative DNA primase/helicase